MLLLFWQTSVDFMNYARGKKQFRVRCQSPDTSFPVWRGVGVTSRPLACGHSSPCWLWAQALYFSSTLRAMLLTFRLFWRPYVPAVNHECPSWKNDRNPPRNHGLFSFDDLRGICAATWMTSRPVMNARLSHFKRIAIRLGYSALLLI